jgi:hypothetical protein
MGVLTPNLFIQTLIALAVNSEPLLERRRSGIPRTLDLNFQGVSWGNI